MNAVYQMTKRKIMTETTGILLNFTDEQMQLRELVRDVVKKEVIPNRAYYDEHNEYPKKVLEKFKEAGLYPAMFEEDVGGLGLGVLAQMILVEEVSYGCLGINVAFATTKLGSSHRAKFPV